LDIPESFRGDEGDEEDEDEDGDTSQTDSKHYFTLSASFCYAHILTLWGNPSLTVLEGPRCRLVTQTADKTDVTQIGSNGRILFLVLVKLQVL
jgi:hypothetical protein